MNEFTTTDINVAAALMTEGHDEPRRDWKVNPVKCTFIFEDDGSIAEKVDNYKNRKLTVDAHTLMENFWLLKTKLYEDKKSRRGSYEHSR